MALTEEEKKNWKMFAMLLIGTGLAINLYLLWQNDKKIVTSAVMRQGMNAMVSGIGGIK